MDLSFITKVNKTPEKNHTPIDAKKLAQPKKNTAPHTAAISNKHIPKIHIPFEFDKYTLITIISVLFFISGLGFWIYVNYFMS